MLSMKSIFTQNFLQFHPFHLLLGVALLFATVGGNNGAGAEYHLLTNTIVSPLHCGQGGDGDGDVERPKLMSSIQKI